MSHVRGSHLPPTSPTPHQHTRVGLTAILLLLGGSFALSGCCIPSFINTQMKAKRSEAITNLDGIRTAEKAYHHEWDAFTSAGLTPEHLPGREPTDFSGGGYTAFQNLGWVADGLIRCQYEVTAQPSDAGDDFLAIARCDIDGDGVEAVFQANRAEKAKMITPDGVF